MSEEDELIVTKAMLLGCTFHRSSRGLHYNGLPPSHPLSKARVASTYFYGYEDPIQMAREYVDYMVKHHAARSRR